MSFFIVGFLHTLIKLFIPGFVVPWPITELTDFYILLMALGYKFLVKSGKSKNAKRTQFATIVDRFKSLQDVQQALKDEGVEAVQLIIGVDFTKSNEWTGKRTFQGKCLHHLSQTQYNPYQQVIDIIGRTLEPFDADKLIPSYGFGDTRTTDRTVFPFFQDERPCFGVAETLHRYAEVTHHVQLSGPTSFKPIIDKAIEIVKQERAYHVLVIVADGQVTNRDDTIDAIVRASQYPLSIVMVGVGDGPWDDMETFDDGLPERKFDNFQFVNFHRIARRAENLDVAFSVAALQEIPDQYAFIKDLGLLNQSTFQQ